MPTFAALGVLVLLLIAAQLYFGDFVSPGNMSALLLDNAYLMVIAVGMTFVILTAGIDLSVGLGDGLHRDPAAPASWPTGCRRWWPFRSSSSRVR